MREKRKSVPVPSLERVIKAVDALYSVSPNGGAIGILDHLEQFAKGCADQLDPVFHAELRVETLHVRPKGVNGDTNLLSDLHVLAIRENSSKDFRLTSGEMKSDAELRPLVLFES